ncbi:MAG: glucose-6-phosphate dehydrogenase [Bacteroidota bacterium]
MKKTDNQMLIIFGASGDLTARKLIPALFALFQDKDLPDNYVVLGTSRSTLSDEDFRNRVALESAYMKEEDHQKLKTFSEKIFYQPIDSYEADYAGLKERIDELNTSFSTEGNYIFYLSTPPSVYKTISQRLSEADLSGQSGGWRRLIVEKPFGYDLKTAQALNRDLLEFFEEDQIYRIDHYLGKETVQNLLVTRFSNSVFEPLWNRNYIQHIEITNAESLGVEKRGGYYDKSGALRDMFQNHLLQVLSLVAMEPPVKATSVEIRNEKVKVLKAMRIMNDEKTLFENTIRGQYRPSEIEGKKIKGYREENGVDPESLTETFAAIKLYIDNWRWKGVPFYVRTAKRMPTKVTEVVIHFKSTPHSLFVGADKDNKLIIRIHPDEGIMMKFGVKVPGQGFIVEEANMDFYYADIAINGVMNAYERLLMDAMQGDATLYARGDEVEAAWRFVDPILNYWNGTKAPMYGYAAGVWGPENSDDFIEGNYFWRNPGPNLADDPGYCVLC